MHEMAIVLKNTFYEMTYKEIEILSSPVTLEQWLPESLSLQRGAPGTRVTCNHMLCLCG